MLAKWENLHAQMDLYNCNADFNNEIEYTNYNNNTGITFCSKVQFRYFCTIFLADLFIVQPESMF
jgi:hypothetical protein